MQFAAQAQYYREHYPDTSFDVIVLDDQPVGRLYVARWTDEIRIVDIALLPESCNRGIGTTLVRELQAEAQASDRPLRITSSASIRAAALRAIGLPAGRGPGRLSVPRVAAWLAASGLNQNSRLPKPTGEGEKGGTILPFPFLLCSLTRGCR
jgi:GNAT superfamily N-acetyltransferase